MHSAAVIFVRNRNPKHNLSLSVASFKVCLDESLLAVPLIAECHLHVNWFLCIDVSFFDHLIYFSVVLASLTIGCTSNSRSFCHK